MRFVTFLQNGFQKIGLVTGEGVLDLHAAKEALGISVNLPESLVEVIEAGDSAIDLVQSIQKSAESSKYILPVSDVQLLAPIPRPRKNIFCVGKNYVEHAKEMKADKPPEHPILFSKAPTSVIGPDADIDSHPGVTEKIDYEGELAIVIGKKAKSVKKEQAYEYVFGYTIINDVSARDKQFRHTQWLLGKSLDTFCPMGPVLVHKSELPDPQNLNLETRVNGEVRQSSNTSLMIFDIPTLIATITEGTTLEPGDIIATGTPAGVGMGFEPPRLLQAGDVVEVEIEGIGVLRNQVK
ncbi:fumarylacetoacetate hydrolase family protein [Effusibacillus consociatus]|uniref:Fumarylacetoacetate hydrolase family protein n=1 Tax=Effusibacillus consociatus TaxID=1117041 RepID=A0ABV9Q9U1_9BACL